MLTVETLRKIRLAARDGKQSIRQITKDFNVSRNTVRKVLRSDQTHFEYHRDTVHRPKLGPFIDTLTTLLKHDQPLPLKQRRTAQGYYEALQAEGYRGAYDSVRRFVKHWRAEHQGSPTDAYIPLVFEPGEAFQFDWSHEKIVIAGAMTDVKIAHIRLCHSRLFLTVADLRESQEMVFDAHRRAFEFFGGVTRRGIYDNMKTAVCRILRGKERDFNRRFEELASHYLFEPVACTPAAGWEKGQVENQVRTVRRRLFTPTRKAASLDDLNHALRAECLQWAKNQRHPVLKDQTVWSVFVSERPSLLTLPRAFDGYAERTVRVSSTSLVNFDRNRYSVDCKAAGRTAELRSYADKIVVMHDGECVAQHCTLLPARSDDFQPLALPASAAEEAGCVTQWRAVQGLGSAPIHSSYLAAAEALSRLGSATGRHPRLRARLWPGCCCRCLQRGTEQRLGEPRRHHQPAGPATRGRQSRDRHHPGPPGTQRTAGCRLRPL